MHGAISMSASNLSFSPHSATHSTTTPYSFYFWIKLQKVLFTNSICVVLGIASRLEFLISKVASIFTNLLLFRVKIHSGGWWLKIYASRFWSNRMRKFCSTDQWNAWLLESQANPLKNDDFWKIDCSIGSFFYEWRRKLRDQTLYLPHFFDVKKRVSRSNTFQGVNMPKLSTPHPYGRQFKKRNNCRFRSQFM